VIFLAAKVRSACLHFFHFFPKKKGKKKGEEKKGKKKVRSACQSAKDFFFQMEIFL
jgi:hypothetical protein